MNYTILSTKPGQPDFHLFGEVVKQLYPEGSPRFRLPENINEEFLLNAYVLLVNDIPKARFAIYDPAISYQGMKAITVGNYESIYNSEVTTLLFQKIKEEAIKAGAEYIIGPMNGTTWDHYRFSNHNDHPNFFPEPYHHSYYNQQFLEAGYQSIARYSSSIDRNLGYQNPALEKREEELIRNGIVIRSIKKEAYEKELNRIYEFSLKAFEHNFLYTPISLISFLKKYLPLAGILKPEHVHLAENKDGALVGLLFCIDDLYNTSEKSIVIKTLARHPDAAYKGLGNVMVYRLYQQIRQEGYHSAIHAMMINTGVSSGMSENYMGEVYKAYTLYGISV